MHADRFPSNYIATLKRSERLWAGRYQQRPNTAGGGIFKIRDWRLYADLPPVSRTILSVDASFTGGEGSSFVAIGVIGQRLNVRQHIGESGTVIQEHEYYMPYCWHNQAGIIETKAAILDLCVRYPQVTTKLIEAKANGPAIIQQLSLELANIQPYDPGRANKETRAVAIQGIHARGDLLLPIADVYREALKSMGRNTITIGEWWDIFPPIKDSTAEHAPVADWAKILIDELALFPSGEHDDQVDMTSQGIIWLEGQPAPSGWFGFSSVET